jgi:hypothetical protein
MEALSINKSCGKFAGAVIDSETTFDIPTEIVERVKLRRLRVQRRDLLDNPLPFRLSGDATGDSKHPTIYWNR